MSNLHFALSIGLLKMQEYDVVAEAVENDPELAEGILVDAAGFLRKPERINMTRALVTSFLWRYLRDGEQLNWNEARFIETFNELITEIHRKSIVVHTTLPLSNLRMDINALDFESDLKLMPASRQELERWMNPDRDLPPVGAGPPQWNSFHVDSPAVLHAKQTIIGRPPSADLGLAMYQLPPISADNAITALGLVLNTPIAAVFREHDNEGLIAFGGRGTSWGWSPPPLGPIATINQENATQVIHIWQRLQTSPNIGLLKLPLRRWESSVLRPNLEDRLIDAWISLEALLLGGLDGELSYRVAIRLAEFLGTTGADRKAIYDNARISYTWRSVIVHALNSKKVAKRQPLPETVRLTTEYLRSALLKVLDLSNQFDPGRLESELLSRDS
ncbi:MAG: hypothetical protein HY663_00535 [Chloroflexi bacterium]|nr:hypothetical protein [Chloroflexota bacterium]